MRKTPLIYLFGPDGSGKTTLAKTLSATLNSKGLKTRVLWMRGSHTLASMMAKTLKRFKAFQGGDNPYYHIKIPKPMKTLWALLETASILPVLLKYLIYMKLYLVVSDRFLPDFILWVALTTRQPRYTTSIPGKTLLTLSTKLGRGIHVTASIPTLRARRDDAPCSFVAAQKKAYDTLAKILRTPTIDTTSKNIYDALATILKTINSPGNSQAKSKHPRKQPTPRSRKTSRPPKHGLKPGCANKG